jgi:D-alanyl-D-alanine carboxypeptidase
MFAAIVGRLVAGAAGRAGAGVATRALAGAGASAAVKGLQKRSARNREKGLSPEAQGVVDSARKPLESVGAEGQTTKPEPIETDAVRVESESSARPARSNRLVEAIVGGLHRIEGQIANMTDKVAELILAPKATYLEGRDEGEEDTKFSKSGNPSSFMKTLMAVGLTLAVPAILGIIKLFNDHVKPLLDKFGGWLKDDLYPFITKTIPEFFGRDLPKFFNETIPNTISAGVRNAQQKFESIISGFDDALNEMQKKAGELVKGVGDRLSGSKNGALAAIGRQISGLGQGMIDDVAQKRIEKPDQLAEPMPAPSAGQQPRPSKEKVSDVIKKKDGGVDVDGLHPAVQSNLVAMASEHKEKTGRKVQVNSAKRSTAKQKALYDGWLRGGKKGPAPAKPGRSRHESGLAVDLQTTDADKLASTGLLQKYGFHRPLMGGKFATASTPRGETWHIEPTSVRPSAVREDGNSDSSPERPETGRGGQMQARVISPTPPAASTGSKGQALTPASVPTGGLATPVSSTNDTGSMLIRASMTPASDSVDQSQAQPVVVSAPSSGKTRLVQRPVNPGEVPPVEKSFGDLANSLFYRA